MTREAPTASRKVFYLALVFFIAIADQLSKWFITEMVYRPRMKMQPQGFIDWIMNAPERLGPIRIEITSFYNLVMVWNEGVSFGMMNSMGDIGPLILMGIALVVSLILMVWMLGTQDRAKGAAFALIIGGGIGNVIDRARFGGVIDFIDLHAFGYHWPAFNIADCTIVVGIVFIIVHALFFEKESSS